MHSMPRVLEQQNLLGGMDLAPSKGKRQRTRKSPAPGERRGGFAKALALVVEHGRRQARELGTTSLSRCPRCGHIGPTLQDFGTRIIRGERRPQSWCRACRAHALPPLHRPVELSARAVKATPAARAPRAARVAPASAEGWLFPPETLAALPPRAGKRSPVPHH